MQWPIKEARGENTKFTLSYKKHLTRRTVFRNPHREKEYMEDTHRRTRIEGQRTNELDQRNNRTREKALLVDQEVNLGKIGNTNYDIQSI